MTALEYRTKGLDLKLAGKEKESIPYFEKSVKGGNLKAINDLGEVYLKLNNNEKAYEYFKQAVEHDVPEAYVNLGNFYKEGIIVEKDIQFVINCYEKSTKLGYSKGYYELYKLYSTKRSGVKQNCKKATEYLKRGANLEIRNNSAIDTCIIELSYNLKNGVHTKKQVGEAFKLLYKARKLTSPLVQYRIGYHFAFGKGTKRDFDKALIYLKNAYDLDYYNSCSLIGQIYLFKFNDPLLAYYYFRRGMTHGSLECANKFIEVCFSGKINKMEYSSDNGIAVSYITMECLLRHPNDYINERKAFNEIRVKYANKCYFDQMENDIKNRLANKDKPHLVA